MSARSCRGWEQEGALRCLLRTGGNALALGLTNVRTGKPDVGADLRVDLLWSNPPIRIGKPALHELLLTWLPRLAPDGRAVMVVGKNLGGDSLQRWMTDQGYPCERVGSAKGFRVLRATNAGPAPS